MTEHFGTSIRRRRLTRRGLLRTGGATLLAPLAGCDLLSTSPAEEAAGEAAGTDRSNANGPEAPSLAKQVRAGALPPVEDRLPDDPLVVEPVESAGQYGGTWRSWLQGLGATYIFDREVGYDFLVRWSPDWSEVVPNLAAGWEVDDDGREYTFHLRTGVRWSDGKPFTADDVVFAYDDVLGNTDLYPVPVSYFVAGDEMAELERIDDHTVRFIFAATTSLFLERLAGPGGYLVAPRHYLRQFHPDHADDPDELDQVVDAEGFAEWADLFWDRNNLWLNPDLPTLNAWRITNPLGEGDEAVFERNPFYWKTDPEGSQLPYLDEVRYRLISDLDVALLATTNGEISFNHPTITGGVSTGTNKPVLAQNREVGDYAFVDAVPSTMNHMIIMLNLNHEDPQLRSVFQNRDFRVGLSYAIDREELIQTVFQRQGEPWQAGPRKESDYYDEELATQYTEYSPERANEHLDAAGYSERDDSGIRLRSDGTPITFTIEVVTEEPQQLASLELVKEYWREVGVQIHVQPRDRTLFNERTSGGNLQDAAVWTGDGGYGDELFEAGYYIPALGHSARWAYHWNIWYQTDGAEGAEPPEPGRRQVELYDRIHRTTDPDERRELFRQILQLAKEQFWVIGTVLPVGTYGTVHTSFRNVPDFMPAAWTYPTPGPTRPEQFFTTEA